MIELPKAVLEALEFIRNEDWPVLKDGKIVGCVRALHPWFLLQSAMQKLADYRNKEE